MCRFHLFNGSSFCGRPLRYAEKLANSFQIRLFQPQPQTRWSLSGVTKNVSNSTMVVSVVQDCNDKSMVVQKFICFISNLQIQRFNGKYVKYVIRLQQICVCWKKHQDHVHLFPHCKKTTIRELGLKASCHLSATNLPKKGRKRSVFWANVFGTRPQNLEPLVRTMHHLGMNHRNVGKWKNRNVHRKGWIHALSKVKVMRCLGQVIDLQRGPSQQLTVVLFDPSQKRVRWVEMTLVPIHLHMWIQSPKIRFFLWGGMRRNALWLGVFGKRILMRIHPNQSVHMTTAHRGATALYARKGTGGAYKANGVDPARIKKLFDAPSCQCGWIQFRALFTLFFAKPFTEI